MRYVPGIPSRLLPFYPGNYSGWNMEFAVLPGNLCYVLRGLSYLAPSRGPFVILRAVVDTWYYTVVNEYLGLALSAKGLLLWVTFPHSSTAGVAWLTRSGCDEHYMTFDSTRNGTCTLCLKICGTQPLLSVHWLYLVSPRPCILLRSCKSRYN